MRLYGFSWLLFSLLLSPFFSFVVPCKDVGHVLLMLSTFTTFTRGGSPADDVSVESFSSSTTAAAPCWTQSCRAEVIEEDLVDDFVITTTTSSSSDSGHAIKVTCHAKVHHLEQLCLDQLPTTTKILEIRNTSLTRLPSSAFSGLNFIRKLDLRFNEIRDIEPFAFEGLSNLKRLDLSFNNITSLNASQLAGLSELVRLKVGHNPLKRVEESIQDALPALRALELGSTSLHCDCRLSWLVSGGGGSSSGTSDGGKKKKKRPPRLLGTPSCQSPQQFRGIRVRKVSPALMICDDEATSVTLMEIEPGIDQVVFAGDSLQLRCKVSGQSATDKVWWRQGETQYAQEGNHPDITVNTISANGRLESYVDIPQLSWGHSGEWACMVEGRGGNNSKSVSIYVIHHGTRYCSVNQTSGNKGHYTWPRTVAEVSIDMHCESLYGSSTFARPKARHACDHDGRWHSLDTSQCPFLSETTRILERFSQTNVTTSHASLLESARLLRNFTSSHGGAMLRDPMDIFFISETVRHYSDLVVSNINFHLAAEVLVDVIGSTLSSTRGLLKMSEFPMRSCSSLLKSLWLLANEIPLMSRVSTPLLDVYQVSVHPETFTGISCIWFRKNRHSSDRHFRCNTNNYTALYAIEDEVTDARIRIPSSLFANVSLTTLNSDSTGGDDKMTRLQFFAFDSAKLFPSQRLDSWKITSPVVGVRINDKSALSSNTNVYVTLRSTIYSHNVKPGSWRTSHQDNDLRWNTDGCQIIRFVNSLIVFKCSSLGHYGLLQDMTAINGHMITKGAAFKASPPGVYLGSTICCFFLMASIATWGIHHGRIVTTSKNKHSFLNTWVALLFLVALFTVGVHQTEAPSACRLIGIVLHYLTMCVLLWLLVSLTNLYKRVNKMIRPPLLPQDEPSSEVPLPPKPMLRFYLVGWGIALILCGISAAVNLPHYATFSYCFLKWTPSMAAFYAPSAALVLILASFFLLTQCVLRASNHAIYSEATAGNTETTELELLDTASPVSENAPGDELSLASSTISLSDAQHSPTTQLRAHAVTLILFLLTWASAAITTAAPFEDVIPSHSTIFSIVYAICSSSLGLFIFIYFCVSRTDAMEAWKEATFIRSSPTKEDETHLTVANNVTSSSFLSPASSQTPPSNNLLSPPNTSISSCVAPSMHSVEESTHTMPTNKSSSFSHHVTASNLADSKASNALHMLNLNTMQENVQYAPELFYNPKQAGVARRFFQKQRLKQMMKQNNLEVNRVDSDCNSSTVYKPRTSNVVLRSESDLSGFDSSYLGVSNKVNNTNIHVDSMYTTSKHSGKTLAPELLCVLGPSRDTCSIVSSMENNQHQLPVTKLHQCGKPAYYCPKHLNISRSPIQLLSQSEDVDSVKNNSFSPIFFSEQVMQSLNESSDGKSHRQLDLHPGRGKRPLRGELGSSLSREIDQQLTSPQLLPTASELQDESVPHLNLSHGSSTPPHLTDPYFGATAELEWLHLLHKKTGSSFEAKLNYTEESSPYFDDLCCSDDEDSVEGVALECENWGKELEGRVYKRDLGSFEATSEDGRSSIGTSLVPEVDPSPPPSLPLTDSPLDSPLHKFHQNSPDSVSLNDSGSLLSPGCPQQRLFPSQPLVSPITPTLTLTASTPVNTPVSPSTPSSRGSVDVDLSGSESLKEARALLSHMSETPVDNDDDVHCEEGKSDSSSSSKETDV